jgi:flagellar biosynthesis/type III secretory pathway protein FliH
MARVIKAGDGQKATPRPPTRVVVPGQKKVIERAVFQAKLDAEQILERAQQARQASLAEGRRQAARAREEAMARGAAEAFAHAADDALLAFRRRADRYAEAAVDIRVLALEVVKKVLGVDPSLQAEAVERILRRGMAQLRARRRLRVQVAAARLDPLAVERPRLLEVLRGEPDLVLEGAADVGAGFARVVTEIGGALCAESAALDALAQAVDVAELPRVTPLDDDDETAVKTTAAGEGGELDEIDAVEDEAMEDDDLDLFMDEAVRSSSTRKR